MIANLRLVFTISIFFLCFYGFSQDVYWQKANVQSAKSSNSLKKLSVSKAKTFVLKESKFREELQQTSKNYGSTVIYFPDESGEVIGFKVKEASVFSDELAKKYPQIKSYKGVALNDISKSISFSVSPEGMQSMLIDKKKENPIFMQKTDAGNYVLYSRGINDEVDKNFICETKEVALSGKGASASKLVEDQILRKYRVAIAATGEYTGHYGGTKAGALAGINTTITRINMVFETDLGITLELVTNNDLVIYTDAATDPYSSNLNVQAQTTFNSVLGADNYDIGHLFHKNNNAGDAGFVGSVCKDTQKGSAFSSGVNPQGDIFDIDFVAHEMGHQLGANHTWSFESEGTLVQAEPGSGSTIMGYAGISGVNNVATAAQDYFHHLSIKQISEYLETTNCAVEIALVNNPPVVTPTSNYIIPKGTAFVLDGEATDPDPADVLTYTWEQTDDGVVTNSTFGPTNPSGANFRSQQPTTNTERYFPKLSRVVQGNLTQTNPSINSAWETVSNVERDFNFAFTVRDNNTEGGQVSSDIVSVHVSNNAGPFQVLSQSSNVNYEAGSVQEVTWDVANTNTTPVNAQRVSLYLSVDGGVTFPFLLADDIPNSGTHNVLIPGQATTQARIMVKASDNVFFAVNSSNFTITASEVVLNFSDLDFEVCQPDDLIVPFVYETYLGFAEPSTFNVMGMPLGLTANISPTSATANNTAVSITFSNTDAVAIGDYPLLITSSSASVNKQVEINLSISASSFSEVVMTAPLNNEEDVTIYPLFEWDEEIASTSYDIEIATDNVFSNIVESSSVIFNSYKSAGLLPETVYYWRVKPKNSCGEGVFNTPFSFTTTPVDCRVESASDLPKTISSSGTPTISSTITVIEDIPISDVKVNLNISHTYLADLTITLTSPSGTQVVLISNSCGDTRNVNATFDANAASFICGNNPAISGVVKPLGSLASFNGESSLGDWVLEVKDNASGDGGSLVDFSLELCVEGELRPDADNDGVFDDGDDLCLGTPNGQEVDIHGCAVYRFNSSNFTVAIDSESCRSSNDGAIRVVASTSLNYTATVVGNGISTTGNFTSFYEIDTLEAGDYNICITGTDGTNNYEEYCFDVVVSQPDEFIVGSNLSADGKSVTLDLEGSENYTITLNGESAQIGVDEIVLDLKNGVNTLKVQTDLLCQGVFEETIIVSDTPILYPNPVAQTTKIFTGLIDVNCTVSIFGINGKFFKSINYTKASTLNLDVSELAPGLYIIKLQGEGLNQTFKLVKN